MFLFYYVIMEWKCISASYIHRNEQVVSVTIFKEAAQVRPVSILLVKKCQLY